MKTGPKSSLASSIKTAFLVLFFSAGGLSLADSQPPGWTLKKVDWRDYVTAHLKSVQTEGGVKSYSAGEPVWGQDQPEIVELARGLRYDPILMYKFVHDYIEVECLTSYGLVKGPYMTLMDQSGNDFDQASLLVALLRQAEAVGKPEAPYTIQNVRYVFGWIKLTQQEYYDWILHVDDRPDDYDPLAPMPAPHAWVRVYIDDTDDEIDNGQDYVFDPSMKFHTYTRGIDLETMMTDVGYAQSSFLASAIEGGSANNDFVEGLNQSAITTDLTQFSTDFISYLRTHYPAASLEDIIGGAAIVPAGDVQLQDFTSLPYDLELYHFQNLSEIPDEYKNILEIQHNGIDTSTLDSPLYSSTIYGRRLTIFYDELNRPVLALDGVARATGTISTPGEKADVALKFTPPTGEPINQLFPDTKTKTPKIRAGGSYCIVNGWGCTSPEIIGKHRKILQQYRRDPGLGDDSEKVLGESLAIIGLTWLAECYQSEKIVNQVNGTHQLSWYDIGICGQYDAPYIDMPLGYHLCVPFGHDKDFTSFFVGTGQSSAFEGGVWQQLQSRGAVSTIKLFEVATADTDPYGRIYKATSSNWDTVGPDLVGYTDGENGEKSQIENRIIQGYSVFLPKNGDLQSGIYEGMGYIAVGDFGDLYSLGYLISGDLYGGFTLTWEPADAAHLAETTDWLYIGVDGRAYISQPQSEDPIALVTGTALYEHSDLTIGSGDWPFSLEFKRHYDSASRLEDGPLGLGWTHNFDITVRVNSDGFQAMGKDSPVDAAAAIVTTYICADLLSTNQSPKNVVVASLAHNWLMEQMIDNVVTIKQPGNMMQFVKLPDDNYNPPPGRADTLSLVTPGDDEYYQLTGKHDDTTTFNPSGQIKTWEDSQGNKVHFAYEEHECSDYYVTDHIVSHWKLDEGGGAYAYDDVGGNDGDVIGATWESEGKIDGALSFDGWHDYVDIPNEDSFELQQFTLSFWAKLNDHTELSNGGVGKGKLSSSSNDQFSFKLYFIMGNAQCEILNVANERYTAFTPIGDNDWHMWLMTVGDGVMDLYKDGDLKDQEAYSGEIDYAQQYNYFRISATQGWSTDGIIDDVLFYNKVLSEEEIRTLYRQEVDCKLTGVSNRFGRSLTIEYNDDGRISSVTDSEGHDVTYTYDDAGKGHLIAFTDALSNNTSFSYDGADDGDPTNDGLLTSIFYPTGEGMPFVVNTYDLLGRVKEQANANGQIYDYYYSYYRTEEEVCRGSVPGETGDVSYSTIYCFDDHGNTISQQDQVGNETTYWLDGEQRQVLVTYPQGNVTQYSYDSNHNPTRIIQAPEPDSGLVARWSLDEGSGAKACDLKGNNHGTVHGAQWTTGQIEGALSFNGVDDYVDIGNDPSLDLTDDFTIAAWIKTTEGRQWHQIVSRYNASDTVGYAFGLNADALNSGHLSFWSSNHGSWVTGSGSVRDDIWHHVAATLEGTAVNFYIDGALDKSTTSAAAPSTNQNFAIGARNDALFALNGLIDDVRIYSEALLTTEIADLADTTNLANHNIIEEYTYETQFNKVNTYTDPGGNVTNYDYDAVGNLTTIIYPAVPIPGGGTYPPDVDYTYNSHGQVLTTTDALEMQTQNTYNSKGELTQTTVDYGTGNLNIATQMAYDTVGNVIQTVDPRGNTTTSQYDNMRRLTQTTGPDPFRYETHYTYEADGKLSEVRRQTDTAGVWQQTSYTYTSTRKKDTVTDPMDHPTNYDYDSLDRLWMVTDAEDNVTERQYYPDGQLWKIIDAKEDDSVTYTYTANGGIETLTDARGNTTTYEYDEFGRLKKTIYPDPGTGSTYEQLTYDAAGRISEKRTRGGQIISYTYDALNRLQTKTVDGDTIQYSYDLVGRLVDTTDPSSGIIHNYYDNIGRLLSVTYPGGETVAYEYDPAGNRTELTYPDLTHVNYNYDSLNRLISICADDLVGYWKFDEGSGTEVYDSVSGNYGTIYGGATWTTGVLDHALSFDGLNDYVEIQNNPKLQFDSEDCFTLACWIKTSDGSKDNCIRTQNDAAGYTGAYGLRVKDGVVNFFIRDQDNNLVVFSGPTLVNDGQWHHIAGIRDAVNDNLVIYVDGLQDNETVDTTVSSLDSHRAILIGSYLGTDEFFNGEIDEVRIYDRALPPDEVFQLYNDTQHDAVLVRYDYDALSRRVTAEYANGSTATYDYDMANRLENLYNQTNTGNHDFAYTYDNVGNRLTMTVNGSDVHSYTYDNIYQLTNVDYPAGFFADDTTFNHDAAGNRQSVTNGGLTTYVANNLNQYSYVAGVSHSHDQNGNLTSDGTNTYTYDAENRLTSAETTDHSITYTYDPQGRRISREVDGRQTRYIYDGDQVICVYDSSDRLMRKFIYGTGIDEPVRMTIVRPSADIGGGDAVDIEDIRTMAAAWLTEEGEGGFNADADLSFDGKIDNVDSDILSENWLTGGSRAARNYYYHYDGLGSVIALTDSAGNTIETYAYDVYGRADKTSSVGNPYLFTGRRFDTETELYYYRARYYSPIIGRFLQTDPIGYEGGINLYAYCGTNPIILIDPFGLCGEGGGIGDYFWSSGKQLLLGNYTEDVTLLGTGGQVGVGLLGIDLPLDIRDLFHDITHWEWSWGHVGQTGLDLVALAPIIGALKYTDEAATLVKQANKVEGIYEFTAKSGKRYVGQSGRLGARIGDHLRPAGKLSRADLGTVKFTPMSSSTKKARRIAEQIRINDLGGVRRGGELENLRNAIDPKYWAELGIRPPR
jgi:RHS repeat-associated protein